MKGHLRTLGPLLVWLWTVSALTAQSDSQAFVSYVCQHKPVTEIALLLKPLLPQPAADASVQLVVDQEGNRILLSGPGWVHDIAQKLVAEVDRPNVGLRQDADTSSRHHLHAYGMPTHLHASFFDYIQQHFGSTVRAVADDRTQRVFVTASEMDHRTIADVIDRTVAASNAQTQAARVASGGAPNFAREAGSESVSQPERVASTPDTRPRMASRFVRVPNGTLKRLQTQLQAIFGSRYSPTRQPAVFELQTATDPPGALRIEFDSARSAVLVDGSDQVSRQLLLLIDALTRVDGEGRAARVFGLQRKKHTRLRKVIEKGAVDNRLRRTPLSPDPQASIRQASYFQDAAAQPLNAPDGAGVGPLRQFEGVDVESLPDLDVIILRGPDQDLDQLAEIIQQLERISADAQADIRVYPLKHVPSSAIVEILDQVSGDLVGTRQGKVSATALVKPNAVLLVGWGDAVTATEDLIKQLDQPVAPESQSEVYQLKHASAEAVRQTLQTFFQNRGGLGPRIQLANDPRTNSLIAYAAPRDLDEIRKLVDDIDQPEGAAVNRARVIPIENALATDVAETLQQAIQSAASGGRSAAVELQIFDADGQKLLRSGTLQNVQITPNPRNNTLIVSSPPENIELLEALIRQLDSPTGQAKIKVFRIINGDAASLIQTLRSLIPSAAAGAAGTGSGLSATGEAGLAPLRFSVDVRSNSIIATGSEGDLRIVEALLAKLDQTNSLQRKTAVYRLKNSPAIDVANAVNQYLFNRRQLDSAVPGQQNPFTEIEREVVVVPEPVANKLILAATPRYFEEIQQLIEKLDESPPQVVIQVLIAEVALNNADEFGVELGLQDSVLFDRSLLGDLLTTSVTEQQSTADGIVTTTQDLIQAATNIPRLCVQQHRAARE